MVLANTGPAPREPVFRLPALDNRIYFCGSLRIWHGNLTMAMMNLQEFVKNSLTEILKGIVESQKDEEVGKYIARDGIGHIKFPPNSGVVHETFIFATTVKFDIAVTVENRAEGGSGLKLDIGVVGGRLGVELAERSEGISRIEFAVPLVLPRSTGA